MHQQMPVQVCLLHRVEHRPFKGKNRIVSLPHRKAKRMVTPEELIQIGTTYIITAIKEMGFNVNDGNFVDTPERVARAYTEILSGVPDTNTQINNILASKFPSEGYDQMIVAHDIKTFSICPHHLQTVSYTVAVGYIPSHNGFVLGLSKLARICDVLARRPVLQEALTMDIGKAIERIEPLGTGVYIIGNHGCMRNRGVKQLDSFVTTSYNSGLFRKIEVKEEFFRIIAKGEK